MSKKVDSEVQRIMKAIDQAGEPKKMTPDEWKDFLEELASEIDIRLECIADEERNEEEEDDEDEESD